MLKLDTEVKNTSLTPVGYFLLVKPQEVEEVTEGGIILSGSTLKQDRLATDLGVIQKIGPIAWHGFADGTPWAKVGDVVMFAKYAGKRITDPETGVEYLLINDNDVLSVVDIGENK